MPNQSLQTTSESFQHIQTPAEQYGPSGSSTNQPLDSLRLLNFRIPQDLKNQFQTKCRRNRIPMTSELTRMVMNYVSQDSMVPSIPNTSPQATILARVQRTTYRDPNTGLLFTNDEAQPGKT
jgi:hypothetical protein